MIRQLESGTLRHAVKFVQSEPKISFNPRAKRFFIQSELAWYEVNLEEGPLELTWLRKGRRFYTTQSVTTVDVSREFYRRLLETNPAPIALTQMYRYIWVDKAFYEADIELTFEQAVALARAGDRKRARKIQRAIEVTQVRDSDQKLRRETIQDDVKYFIWNRDHGRCVHCNTPTDLQYDHIIPLALGGSNDVNNLQLLCGSCNRMKGASLTVSPPSTGIARQNKDKLRSISSTKNDHMAVTQVSNGPPGPLLSYSPKSPRVDRLASTGQRSHEVANRKLQELTTQITTLLSEIMLQGETNYNLLNDLAMRLAKYSQLEATALIGSWPGNFSLRLAGEIDDKRVRKKFSELGGEVAKLTDQSHGLWLAKTKDLNVLTQRINHLKITMTFLPRPESLDSVRRVSSWVSILNEYLEIVEILQTKVSDRKYHRERRKLELACGALLNFCEKKLKG